MSERVRAFLVEHAALDNFRRGAVLASICCKGNHTVSSLADELKTWASVISRNIAALERSGMVHRTDDPTDRRVVHFHATDAGRQRIEAMERWLTPPRKRR